MSVLILFFSENMNSHFSGGPCSIRDPGEVPVIQRGVHSALPSPCDGPFIPPLPLSALSVRSQISPHISHPGHQYQPNQTSNRDQQEIKTQQKCRYKITFNSFSDSRHNLFQRSQWSFEMFHFEAVISPNVESWRALLSDWRSVSSTGSEEGRARNEHGYQSAADTRCRRTDIIRWLQTHTN